MSDDDKPNNELLDKLIKLRGTYRAAKWFDEHEPLMEMILLLRADLARAVKEININRRAIKELRRQCKTSD